MKYKRIPKKMFEGLPPKHSLFCTPQYDEETVEIIMDAFRAIRKPGSIASFIRLDSIFLSVNANLKRGFQLLGSSHLVVRTSWYLGIMNDCKFSPDLCIGEGKIKTIFLLLNIKEEDFKKALLTGEPQIFNISPYDKEKDFIDSSKNYFPSHSYEVNNLFLEREYFKELQKNSACDQDEDEYEDLDEEGLSKDKLYCIETPKKIVKLYAASMDINDTGDLIFKDCSGGILMAFARYGWKTFYALDEPEQDPPFIQSQKDIGESVKSPKKPRRRKDKDSYDSSDFDRFNN